ncbi:hypothetical protein [Pseudoclavibacter sp. 8L]|uniref:hypothetical protein n=1 Tax=Pseudoclavibacter sp. 8L TaxID=2653162 RepID=UPI0012F29A35|nr:hypothetical protein [Pseudoclavibacter sp. 8L]VXB29657.1 hypothetical protein PSCLAVI8L_130413 [Pseudoclavibacter sp. 8L]
MTTDPRLTDMQAGKRLVELFGRHPSWDEPQHDVWVRTQGALAFAARDEEIHAAAVAYSGKRSSFMVLTGALLLQASFELAPDQRPSVHVLPLKAIRSLDVATDHMLFVDSFGGTPWPRGAEIRATFVTETVDFTPFVAGLNSRDGAELATALYMTLRAALV